MPRVPHYLALLSVGLMLLAGCTASTAPCPTASVTVEATVTNGGMDPSAIAVCRGQRVTLEVHSQTDAVFHLHGFDDQVPAIGLTSGQTTTLEFTASVAGQFIIELHDRSGVNSIEIGVLTVNEP
jgi:hypothetical protein